MSFEISFPLWNLLNESKSVTFYCYDRDLKTEASLPFNNGLYLFFGDVGSGKSILLSRLSLLSGYIDKDLLLKERKKYLNNGSIDCGAIKYTDNKGKTYHFNDIEFKDANEIRTDEFCILTQFVDLLPGISVDNHNRIFNNENKKSFLITIFEKIRRIFKNGKTKLKKFNQKVETLSGGERQRLFIKIIFEKSREKKAVWFLDEPFNNLDNENIKMLERIIFDEDKLVSKTAFLVDHRLKDNHSEILDISEKSHILTLCYNMHNLKRKKQPIWLKGEIIDSQVKLTWSIEGQIEKDKSLFRLVRIEHPNESSKTLIDNLCAESKNGEYNDKLMEYVKDKLESSDGKTGLLSKFEYRLERCDSKKSVNSKNPEYFTVSIVEIKFVEILEIIGKEQIKKLKEVLGVDSERSIN